MAKATGVGEAMAQSEHLPIYEATYDLCLSLDQVVRGFPRYHRYSLGADLREAARRCLRLVVRANSRRERAPVPREELEELKAYGGHDHHGAGGDHAAAP